MDLRLLAISVLSATAAFPLIAQESETSSAGSNVDQTSQRPGIHVADTGAQNADEISKQLSNPNSPLSTLTFKHTYTQWGGSLPGADQQTSNVTLFQPTFPFPLESGNNFFIRPALAYVWDQPVYDAGTDTFKSASGWADLGFDVAVGKTFESGWVIVGGVQGTIPLHSDVSGKQWRLGPEFLVAHVGKQGYGGLFPSHQWDINGNYDYSTTQLEILGGVYLPNAWTLFTDTKFTYDWVAGEWTVPLNVSVKKVTTLGSTPVQFSLGIDHFIESNDRFGQDWALTFQIAPVVENFIFNWISG